jgi:hypothetical protein
VGLDPSTLPVELDREMVEQIHKVIPSIPKREDGSVDVEKMILALENSDGVEVELPESRSSRSESEVTSGSGPEQVNPSEDEDVGVNLDVDVDEELSQSPIAFTIGAEFDNMLDDLKDAGFEWEY